MEDKTKYTDWSTREDIKANLQVDLIILLDKYEYPPVMIDDVYWRSKRPTAEWSFRPLSII